MKGKRFAALALALVMTLSLLVLPASAVSFTDMVGHWAREDVESLAGDGVVNGTSATTFSPDRKMTACEALLFCSRAAGVSNADKVRIAADWLPRVKELLPAEMISWAAEEMAVCLETGIISETELKALTDSGNIAKSISRETLAMYLVRAMQLAPLARSLTNYSMSFTDTASISASLQPYVYLLNMYGVVKGDQANRFLPKGSLTRAEMATMLRRAIDFMDDRGIFAELPEYTDYAWVGGTVAAVSTGGAGTSLLTLNNELSGARNITLPAGIEIYENNMLTTVSALKVGQYVRVNMSDKGSPISVRVGGALTTYSGTITSLDRENVTLSVGGVSRSLDIDRFTEVKVGQTSGDRELIDLKGDYTEATCQVDERGHLATLRLSGGTRLEEGLLVSVNASAAGQVIQVSGFNGVTQRYTLPAGTAVTVNGLSGRILSSYVGDYVSLQISNDVADNQVVGVTVDTVTEYIQGSLRSYTTSRSVDTVTVYDLFAERSATYDVDSGAVIRYEGEETTLSKLKKNCFVTLCIDRDDEVTLLDAYPGTSTTEGTIAALTFGTTTTLDVKQADGTVVSFNLDLTELPEIYRDDKVSSIDKLKNGDSVVVSVRYYGVETIEAFSQSADVVGTISRITMESSGVTLDLLLASGETVSYSVGDGVSVTLNDTAISVYSLKPNYKVSMVVSGENVVSIEVDKASDTSTQLKGVVLIPSVKDGTLMLQIEDGSPITVDVSTASFMEADGTSIYLSKLTMGDTVQIYGNYRGATFVATLVIRI